MEKIQKKPNFIMMMVVYLAGIFMGAIDTGIVTPARTLIQNNLNVNANTGIWMITIYTLSFAASIPVMGKLADKYGRKYVYLISISLFGLGSLLCGLSQGFESFTMLVVSRAIQAVGGGGIMPVATAEFGTTFPKEKRGVALGLVGGVFGLANIFGASAGSAILDIFGKNNWQYIFYINIPITLFIVIAGLIFLKNAKTENTKKIDFLGITTVVIMILSLLYGLENLDFFNIETITNTNVYPFLLLSLILIPTFIFIEKKAQDPVINLKYFTNKNILITLIISFVSGFVLMGTIFVPQFAENALKIASGSGGYIIIILGLSAGIGAPISGKLIDKFGTKIVLSFGFIVSILGALFLVFVATAFPSIYTVVSGLVLVGIGMGFTIGTPLNYMMLANTDEKEANSALATLSLVRSIGTAIAPAIMIGFIAHAGAGVQTNVMKLLPKEIKLPPLPYAREITNELKELKKNPQLAEKMKGIDIPDLTKMETIKFNSFEKSNFKLSADLVELMKTSDVTTITKNSKTLSNSMFEKISPSIISKSQQGINKGIEGIEQGTTQVKNALNQLEQGEKGLSQGVEGMKQAISQQKEALSQLQPLYTMLSKNGDIQIPPNMNLADMIPQQIKSTIPKVALDEISKLNSISELNNKIEQLKKAISDLEQKVTSGQGNNQAMLLAITNMEQTIKQMQNLETKMKTLKNAIPKAFSDGKESYLKAIENKKNELENTFQKTLNSGFKNVYLTSAIAGLLAFLLIGFYSKKREHKAELTPEENIAHFVE